MSSPHKAAVKSEPDIDCRPKTMPLSTNSSYSAESEQDKNGQELPNRPEEEMAKIEQLLSLLR